MVTTLTNTADLHAPAMAGHLIRRLNQFSTQVFAASTRAAGYDITPVQFSALDALHAQPGADQATVAELIAYDRATIGGVIERLVAKQLVQREINQEDRRARKLVLTKKGLAVFVALLPIVAKAQDEILQGLTAEERKQFMGLAVKIVG